MLDKEKNEHLQAVPPEVLEEYVLEQIRQFAVEFAQQLVPQITQQHLDLAFSRALYALSARSSQQALKLQLRFTHKCKYIGCSNTECQLCKHNPHKTCASNDNFDEAYADNQVLRARCDADVCVELFNASTGEVFSAPGVEVQLVTIDGEYYDPNAASPLYTVKTLLASDAGTPLLQASGANRPQINGTVVVPLQGGRARLPDVFIADKNDTAKFSGATASKFALMALAVRRNEHGELVAIDHVTPAVSNPFVVKTQRALNDYRKSAFPHYKDEITRLRYIGVVSANRLKDARAHLGQEVPVECVDTVEDLKKLVEYAENNRKVENKLLEMLNMRGRHKHKWDSLRQVLAEKVVYDDNNIRVWMTPDSSGQGLMFYTKQAQVVLDKPTALVQNVVGVDGFPRLQVMDIKDMQDPGVTTLVRAAEECWRQPNHTGWQILAQPIDRVTSWTGMPLSGGPTTPMSSSHPNTPAAAAAIAAAAAAAAASGMMLPEGGPYPQMLRDALGPVPAQAAGVSAQAYPNIPLAGWRRTSTQQRQQQAISTPHRHASDVAMSSVSGTEGGAPPPPAAEETSDSAFMRQHPFDDVERALHQSEVFDNLRHASDTSDAGTAAAAAVALAAAAAAAAGAGGGGGGGAAAEAAGNGQHKRVRGDDEEEGDAAGGERGLYHKESQCRHLPVARPAAPASDAPSAAAALPPSALELPSAQGLELPSGLRLELPSGLPSFGLEDFQSLVDKLSGDLMAPAGSGGATAAAAAGGDQQQQQDQDKGPRAAGAAGQQQQQRQPGGDLVLTNSLSALNLANSLLPPTTSAGAGAGAPRQLGPTGSSLLLPMSSDIHSLKFLSSLAFLHSNLRPEDSFRAVLNQVNLGSPHNSGGLDALLQEQADGGTAAAGAAEPADGGPFAEAAQRAAALSGSQGVAAGDS